MLRTFIGVNFPPEINRKIGKIIAYFKTQTPGDALKWVSTLNLHITIKFLGDIPENKLDQVKAILSESLQDTAPFTINIEGMKIHPDKRNPRLILLGVTENGSLTDIHAILDRALTAVGVDPDNRKFRPHITIARINQRCKRETIKGLVETLSQFKVDSLGDIRVEQVILYKSELTPKGSIYSSLMAAPLNQV